MADTNTTPKHDVADASAIAVDLSDAIIYLSDRIMDTTPCYEVTSFTESIKALAEKIKRGIVQALEGGAQ